MKGCLSVVGGIVVLGIIGFLALGIIGVMSEKDEQPTVPAVYDADGESSVLTVEKTSIVAVATPTPKPKPVTYRQGHTFHVGFMTYNVRSSRFSYSLSDNEFLDAEADAIFLIIDIALRNDDKKAHTIPPFILVDEDGVEYEPTSKGWAVDGVIGPLERLNPRIQKERKIIFDVSMHHRYSLKLLGGFSSTNAAYAFVRLIPK